MYGILLGEAELM